MRLVRSAWRIVKRLFSPASSWRTAQVRLDAPGGQELAARRAPSWRQRTGGTWSIEVIDKPFDIERVLEAVFVASVSKRMVGVVQHPAVTHREDAVGEEPHDRAGHPRKGQSPAAVEPIACTPSSSFAILGDLALREPLDPEHLHQVRWASRGPTWSSSRRVSRDGGAATRRRTTSGYCRGSARSFDVTMTPSCRRAGRLVCRRTSAPATATGGSPRCSTDSSSTRAGRGSITSGPIA